MELDLRKQRILQAIVQDYIATAEPVGSHVLVERYRLGVKSATVRNEMAEMSERGYLRQPHTSAGRVPSDRGYRFYVNRLMPLPVIQEGEAVRIRSAIASASTELDTILSRTCQLLADMTLLPAVATSPDAADTELRQVFLAAAGNDKLLMVLLFSTGRSENRLLLDTRLSASDALILANALNERFGRRTLSELRTPGDVPPPPELKGFTGIWKRIAGEIAAAARSIHDERPMYVEGTTAALSQPEFREVEKLSQFLSTLQERAAVLEMLGQAVSIPGQHFAVQVRIGEEWGRPEIAEYSLVSSSYYIGDEQRGRIGVVGPTRMDYGRAMAAVELMARTMSDLLTRLSVT
ncbi:MAG: heat-inducible transcriptional repressor HrcA [Capsulimonadales bacterium]|nr:heat-inducible transcriptional repressor HrcA [Capsulimonadales bacterium]